jgi:hypothetical protein
MTKVKDISAAIGALAELFPSTFAAGRWHRTAPSRSKSTSI